MIIKSVKSLLMCFAFSLSTVSIADVVIVGGHATPELSKDLAKQIFLKKIDVLPNGIAAVPFDLTDENYIKWDFYKKLAGKEPDQMHSYWSRALFNGVGSPPVQLKTALELEERLMSIPGAIGYVDEKDVSPGMKVLLRIST